MGALQKILEDSGDRLDKETHIEPLLPHVLPFFGSTSPRMRYSIQYDGRKDYIWGKIDYNGEYCRGLAMNSINCILMVHDDDPLSSVIDQFLVLLFGRAQDDDPVSSIQFTICIIRQVKLFPKSGSFSKFFFCRCLLADYGCDSGHLMKK